MTKKIKIFGDRLEMKQKSITRIFYQNINGLELSIHTHTPKLLFDSIHNNDITKVYFIQTDNHWVHKVHTINMIGT